jgi:prophage tail gpP-like protein
MSDVVLLVGGKRYGGWKAARVINPMEALAGAFDLEVSDRWGGQGVPWPIAEEDECRVEVAGQVVIDGYIGGRSLAIDAGARSLGYSGKDKAAVLVRCSVLLDQWTFRRANVYDIAVAVATPFGIPVHMQSGLALPAALPKLEVNPGDTAHQVIERAATASGVLVVSDGAGGVLITRAGSARAAPLVQGENIKSASVDYDAEERFARYVVATQTPGTDDAHGASVRIRAEASDPAVRRTESVHLVLPEAGFSHDYALRRADWEARVRAARAETVSVSVVGATQPSGELWPLNAITYVHAPAIGVDGDMLIATRELSVDAGGTTTTLRLVRPDAFTPEPAATVKRSGGAWKELAGGV